MPDLATNLPDDVDERLWIRTARCEGQDFLWGNSHTFLGRMEAYCPHRQHDFSVSKYEVTESSSEAAMWMEGFLRGNEPSPPEDDDATPAWLAEYAEFHRTGDW